MFTAYNDVFNTHEPIHILFGYFLVHIFLIFDYKRIKVNLFKFKIVYKIKHNFYLNYLLHKK